jgi:hypothetical protein
VARSSRPVPSGNRNRQTVGGSVVDAAVSAAGTAVVAVGRSSA